MSDEENGQDDGLRAGAGGTDDDAGLPDADTVTLADAGVIQDALEPELTTTAAGVRLTEPTLAPAVISEDAADAASLAEAAAEARTAEQHAEEAGVLATGPRTPDDPAAGVEPEGTAPAESVPTLASAAVSLPPRMTAPPPQRPKGSGTGAQADTDAEPEPTVASDADAAQDTVGPFTARSPVDPAAGPAQPPGGPYGLPPAGVVPGAPLETPGDESHGQPVQGPQTPGARTGSRRARARVSAGKSGTGKTLLIAGAIGLVILALLIWAVITIVNLVGRTASDPSVDAPRSAAATPGADGIIAEDVAPLDLAAGDCLLGFVDANTEVTVVTCATPHNAQLLASDFYDDDAEYPGDAELATRAQGVCDGVNLNQRAGEGIAIQSLTVTPTTASWADGDRRLDCFAVAEDGNVLSDSLLAR